MAAKPVLAKSKLKQFGVIATILFVLTAIAAYMSNRADSNTVRYVSESSRLLMLSQRLAKDAQQALSGNSDAFDALEDSRASMTTILTNLDKGEGSLPATKGAPRVVLDAFIKKADKTLADVKTLQDGRAGLVTLAVTLSAIDSVRTDFRGLTQKMIESFKGAQKQQATSFALDIERIGQDAGRLLGVDVSIEEVAQVAIDLNAAEDSLHAVFRSRELIFERADFLFGIRQDFNFAPGAFNSKFYGAGQVAQVGRLFIQKL